MTENTGSKICEKKVSELLNDGLIFSVPTYQRGYRWTSGEVTALLNDINNSEGKYCLQPLIVKKDDNEENMWELIDGQQRLTTLYLIMEFLFVKNSCELLSRECLYKIEYETRDNLLEDNNKEGNIDSYFINQARKTIETWFNKFKGEMPNFCNKLLYSIFFIWYPLPANENNAIDTFIKENANRIPLTSAELIRALLLSENIEEGADHSAEVAGSTNQKEMDLSYKDRQLIAIEWENIEYQLKKDWFWYFLSNEDNTSTRIDLIFDCLARYYYDKIDVFKKSELNKSDPRFSFYVFDRILNDEEIRKSFIEACKIQKDKVDQKYLKNYLWEQTLGCFSFFEDCYEDFEKYHKIGYLVCVAGNKGFDKIYSFYKDIKDNNNKCYLDTQIKSLFTNNKKNKKTICDNTDVYLNMLDYEKSSDKHKIFNVLLLFNILTILSSQGESGNVNHYRFPFDKFKRKKGNKQEHWDIEHIHAVASQLPEDKAQIKNLLDSLIDSYKGDKAQTEEKKFVEKLTNLKNELNEKEIADVKKDYGDIVNEFKTKLDLVDNSIRNLTLLDAETNRSYQNKPFNEKRKYIIKRGKMGQFVPICTMNVFLKVYTDKPEEGNLCLWGEDDRNGYFEAIVKVLTGYFMSKNAEVQK